jgi:hypothetical protein
MDQFIRLALGIVLVELGYFWASGVWQWAAYVAGAFMVLTATLRFCPVYRLLGISGIDNTPRAKGRFWGFLGALTLIALMAGGSYASAFFSRKLFLEEFNAMNHFYKQTLFMTGKKERANAITNYEKWVSAFGDFKAKYTRYRPYALKGDQQILSDLEYVGMIISNAEPLVKTGDLHQAHLDLEKVRPVFQDLFKRNGLSMLAVALVDFHDAMELLLDATNAKDSAKIDISYVVASEKLKAVELEANDAEIQTIRKNLDDLMALSKAAQLDKLPAQADALKSSFVKVYLKRG